MIRAEDIHQEEKELLALPKEAFDRNDVELFGKDSEQLCRVRRGPLGGVRLKA
jgi:hypothetical protein